MPVIQSVTPLLAASSCTILPGAKYSLVGFGRCHSCLSIHGRYRFADPDRVILFFALSRSRGNQKSSFRTSSHGSFDHPILLKWSQSFIECSSVVSV